MIIKFTGEVSIDDSVYKELAADDGQDWDEMSNAAKMDYVKEVEKGGGNEFLDELDRDKVTITSVERD